MSVHPDKTARRAVDACGGTYSHVEGLSGFADGHREGLVSAMDAVEAADQLTADLLEALDGLLSVEKEWGDPTGPEWDRAKAAIARATEARS